MEEINSKANILRAIRGKCVECSGGYAKMADSCNIKDCKLWPYRFGKAMEAKKRKKGKA